MPAKIRLGAEFYRQRAPALAPLLVGKLLCRRLPAGRTTVRLRITETEAYYGEGDTACHAHAGRTERTKTMYLPGGHAYVYLCYGVHWMLNIVTGPADFPEAVLIRGVEGYDGPGKLTRALAVDKSLNGENLAASKDLWLEDDGFVCRTKASPRIGVDYASEKDRKRLWRFTLRQEK
jgi:DNA-3-methyladenine glycosylase